MRICDINPHLRFASEMRYAQAYNGKPVKVRDCRLFYVIDGEAELWIGHRRYTLTAHSLAYCSAGSEYTIHTRDGFSLISLNFDLTQAHSDRTVPFAPIMEWELRSEVYADTVEDSPFLNDHLCIGSANSVYHYLESIVAEYAGEAHLYREVCGTLLKALLLELHRQDPTDIPPKIALVKDYIQQHYAENITNRALADLVGYHEYYLNRIFTAYTGTNLHEFLLKVRLNRASYLILNTDLELKAIPEKTGFRNYPHFSSYFKKAYGYAPAEYRKRLKRGI